MTKKKVSVMFFSQLIKVQESLCLAYGALIAAVVVAQLFGLDAVMDELSFAPSQIIVLLSIIAGVFGLPYVLGMKVSARMWLLSFGMAVLLPALWAAFALAVSAHPEVGLLGAVSSTGWVGLLLVVVAALGLSLVVKHRGIPSVKILKTNA